MFTRRAPPSIQTCQPSCEPAQHHHRCNARKQAICCPPSIHLHVGVLILGLSLDLLLGNRSLALDLLAVSSSGDLGGGLLLRNSLLLGLWSGFVAVLLALDGSFGTALLLSCQSGVSLKLGQDAYLWSLGWWLRWSVLLAVLAGCLLQLLELRALLVEPDLAGLQGAAFWQLDFLPVDLVAGRVDDGEEETKLSDC